MANICSECSHYTDGYCSITNRVVAPDTKACYLFGAIKPEIPAEDAPGQLNMWGEGYGERS